MNISLKLKCSLQSSLYLSTKHLKCITTLPLFSPQHHLHLFFDRNNTATIQQDHELALVSALKSCATLFAISQGQQIHCLIFKSGFISNIFVQNSLINLYAKCGLMGCAKLMFDSCGGVDFVSSNIMVGGYVRLGRLDDARKVFDEMPKRGSVTYTTMIMGLAKGNRWRDAIELFRDMRLAGVTPNEVTMSSVISAYSRIKGVKNGNVVHGFVVKIGLESFGLVLTNLVNIYCVSSCLWDGRRLFDEMAEKNIVVWNIMLNGYSKAGYVDLARELFDRIPDKDVVSWGTMIDGYVQVGRLDDALVMYREMLSSGLVPNEVMAVDLISACRQAMAFGTGRQFHGVSVKLGFDNYDFMQATVIHFYAACREIYLAQLQFELGNKDHIESWNALITGFIKNRMIEPARKLFSEMPERDVVSWSSMIAGYAQHEQPNLALELFNQMVYSEFRPNEITMVSVLSAVAALGYLSYGRWAHEYINNNSIPLNDNLIAAIIDMYAKCGSIETSVEFFNQIRNKIKSLSPWNAIICGLAMHGHAKLSLDIFSDLQRCSHKLNSITFIGVLTACCHAGLVYEGEEHFKNMKNIYNIDPNIKHYGCMVDLLGRAGRLEEAEELIRRMPMKADFVIWGTLLAACRMHDNVEVGERAAQSLARVEPTHGAGRVLLSNIYAEAGRWEDVGSVRQAMQSQRLTKLPAYSGVL
ncbi:pentatricopeptide repeat-containing protein, mitochondrial [Heracleum sosnowskyi]|uniref:Pentatricopeptide repeat-containing protein, mitochondrial n=1 Tax=Heracleum sosnowskyi TaxID=360622 RepID=A0AAD8IKP0_9APIA|nr:pentatricopeptide repeat-containing protein, mitochondrial [Heracleum sosnowskyi]